MAGGSEPPFYPQPVNGALISLETATPPAVRRGLTKAGAGKRE